MCALLNALLDMVVRQLHHFFDSIWYIKTHNAARFLKILKSLFDASPSYFPERKRTVEDPVIIVCKRITSVWLPYICRNVGAHSNV